MVGLGVLPLLNLADAGLTHGALVRGWISEANPLMRLAWNTSPWAFLGLKAALVAFGGFVLWRQRRRPAAAAALVFALAVYAAVVAYQLTIVGSEVLRAGAPMP